MSNIPTVALAAVIDVNTDDLHVYFTFHRPTIEALKGLRIGARWDKELSTWVVPATELNRVAALLDDLGYVWEYAGGHGGRNVEGGWSELLFARAPQRLHAPLFRAVARVVHPDHAGDESMMRELADTWNSRARTTIEPDLVRS